MSEVPTGRIPPRLELCYGCHQFVWPQTSKCPHCGTDVSAARRRYEVTQERAAWAAHKLARLLGK